MTKTAARDRLDAEHLTALARQPQGGHGPWSTTDLLLAAAVDRLGWLRADLYRVQGGRAEYPPPWPRPGIAPTRRRLTPPMRRYLDLIRREHAGTLTGAERAELARTRAGPAGAGLPAAPPTT